MTGTKTYRAWNQMIQRCHNPDNPTYQRYGAVGVKVCARWRRSFGNFLADVGECPSPEHTIDREDNTRGYKPGNCRWLHRSLQSRNRRNVKRFDVNGESLCIPEIATKFGISETTVGWRLRQGWDIKRVISQDPKAYHGRT